MALPPVRARRPDEAHLVLQVLEDREPVPASGGEPALPHEVAEVVRVEVTSWRETSNLKHKTRKGGRGHSALPATGGADLRTWGTGGPGDPAPQLPVAPARPVAPPPEPGAPRGTQRGPGGQPQATPPPPRPRTPERVGRRTARARKYVWIRLLAAGQARCKRQQRHPAQPPDTDGAPWHALCVTQADVFAFVALVQSF